MNLKEFRTKLYGMCGLTTVEKAMQWCIDHPKK